MFYMLFLLLCTHVPRIFIRTSQYLLIVKDVGDRVCASVSFNK